MLFHMKKKLKISFHRHFKLFGKAKCLKTINFRSSVYRQLSVLRNCDITKLFWLQAFRGRYTESSLYFPIYVVSSVQFQFQFQYQSFGHMFTCRFGIRVPKEIRHFRLQSFRSEVSLPVLEKIGQFLKRYLKYRAYLI